MISLTLASFFFLTSPACKKDQATPIDTSSEDTHPCDELDQGMDEMKEAFAALSQGVTQPPTNIILPEATNGTLAVGLHPKAFPILGNHQGTFAAASSLEQGRIVAFSGQDFLGSSERSSLLTEPAIATLVTNAVFWTGQTDKETPPRVLVANESIANILTTAGMSEVAVAPIVQQEGLWSLQDWSNEALDNVDVAVIQVNEWGTLYTGPDAVAGIREFVQNGGGLVIAGSALHYSWWLNYSADRFVGDLILADSGIHWNVNSVPDLQGSTLSFDELSPPTSLWCAYLDGADLDAAQMGRMAPLFVSAKTANWNDDVDKALGRLIADTPSLPVSASDAKARLSADVAATLGPHDWPNPHPWTATFPGVPIEDATLETLAVTLDANYSGALPLGAYAPPGQQVMLTLTEADVARGLHVRVGELYDDLRGLDNITTWNRAPALRREFPVTSLETWVVNPYGGSISLVVPRGETGTIEAKVTDTIPMAVYTLGTSSQKEWASALEKGAPQAVFQEKGRVRMVVERDAAKAIEKPEEVIAFWSGFHASHSDLGQEPTPRMFESHWIFDVQVGWGYANATGERITFPKLSEVWALRTQTGDEDWWLFGHELGHQFQTSNWSGGDITEVAVNLFTMYTLNDYIHGGGEFETIGFNPNTIDHDALKSSRWDSADLFGKLQLYRQLIFEFGWPTFRETFASYYSSDFPTAEYGEFMDGFAIRFSAIVKRDLVAFLQHWEYPMSANAATTIQGFGYESWLPPGW